MFKLFSNLVLVTFIYILTITFSAAEEETLISDYYNTKSILELEHSCNLNNRNACFFLGHRYAIGENNIAIDLNKAKDFYQKGCILYDSGSCIMGQMVLDILYTQKAITQEDYNSANIIFQKGESIENGLRSFTKGIQYLTGTETVKPDYDKALKLFKDGCDLNFGNSCNILAEFYKSGLGVPVDLEKANELYKKGCKLYSGVACVNLALTYLEDSKQDIVKAASLLEKGCNLDDYGIACVSLGTLYKDGDKENNIARDLSRAKALFQKGCDLNVSEGCGQLGSMYAKGEGVEQNFALAKNYFQRDVISIMAQPAIC